MHFAYRNQKKKKSASSQVPKSTGLWIPEAESLQAVTATTPSVNLAVASLADWKPAQLTCCEMGRTLSRVTVSTLCKKKQKNSKPTVPVLFYKL